MGRLVAEVRDILRSIAAGKRLRVDAEIDPALGPVVVDPGKLKQILYNYLSNAVKFTPEGGRISVRARPEGPEGFRLEVEDTGIGIKPEDLKRLFVEFQQLDATAAKKYAGTGLGLALSRRLVEAQGGAVGARSTPGQGSVFHAVLPRAASRRAAEPPSYAARPHAGAPVVLVVEDDERERAWLADALSRAQYAVEAVATGSAAIARTRERRFDAITLDVLLPDGDARDVLTAIRSGGPNAETPVVVITVIAERGLLAGFQVEEILAKPISEDQLVAAIAAAVAPGRGGPRGPSP
jgi:CheY-like chemotaxis protein